MSTVTQILNWISTSLLLPVIVLLLAALGAALISLGGFCATYLTLLQEKKKRNALLKKIRSSSDFKEQDIADSGIFADHIKKLFSFGFDELEHGRVLCTVHYLYDLPAPVCGLGRAAVHPGGDCHGAGTLPAAA